MKQLLIISILLFLYPFFIFAQEYTTDANTVLLMHMNELNPTDTVLDASSNGDNGIATGTTIINGRFGNARNFNGNGDVVTIENGTGLNIGTHNFTIECWVRPTVESPVGNGEFVISKSGPGTQDSLYLNLIDNGLIRFALCDYNNNYFSIISTTPGAIINEWHHIAVVVDYDASTVKIFQDGVQMNTMTTGLLPASFAGSANSFVIGAFDPSGEFSFHGTIDEVRFSNIARTPNEFSIDYGLVAYYPFNGNANDESGNGNNGTNNGGTTPDNDRFGNLNGSMSFNGSTQYLSIPNSYSLQSPTTQLTISAWVYIRDTPNGNVPILCKSLTLNAGQYSFNLHGPKNNIALGVVNSHGVPVAINAPYLFDLNKWYFISVSWDGSNVRFFVNQNKVITTTLADTLLPDNNPLEIGIDVPGATEYFQGKLDDIRIYNRALSENEIDSLYHEGGWDAINPCPGTPTISYSGKTYNTVQIGNQCWMKENLNVGTMINGSANQTNNSTIEKYCYNDDTANCNTYGGLYQWNEAMQYDTSEGAQGICPTGWHMPTSGEFESLKETVNNNGNVIKAVGQGIDLGSGTNISGFSALLAGGKAYNGSFEYLGINAFFWSSFQYDTTYARYLGLFYNDSTISLNYGPIINAIGVRCLKSEVFTLNDSVIGNGTISKTPDQTTYISGSTVQLTATPDSCYHFVNWSGDTSSTQNPITLVMNSNKNITANFAIKKDTIVATSGANGTISPLGNVIVSCGTDTIFTFTPDSGYYVDSVLVDGIKVDSLQGYTFPNVSTNHTIHVTFKEYPSSISGKKYHDLNGNGQFDSGEPLLPNWQITLKKSDSATIDTIATDSSGNYFFSSVTSGKYIVREIQQGGWMQTSVNPDTITVTSGSALTEINFGNGHRSSICGVKYEDKNGNGYRDAGEPGLQGWTIVLGGTTNGTVVTDPSGNYCFTNLPAGYYMLNEAQQGGWKQTQGGYSIQLSSGVDTICNFGNFRYGSISGMKFHDLNGDGFIGASDSGLSGWKIYLEKDGNQFAMRTTAVDGSYLFDSLMYGVYLLSEEQRAGWIQTVHPTKNDTVVSGKTFINRNFGNVFGLSLDVLAKWNMVSLPLGVLDNRKIIVFPQAQSSAFAFEGGYQSKTNLLNGVGYWLKFDSAQSINLIGGVIAQDTISVHAGWNMIGSISDTISTSCFVPVGTEIQSSYFGYLNGYVSSDVILPGKAYWVKVSTDGVLIMKGCIR